MTSALVIIDVQKGMFSAATPFGGVQIVKTLAGILAKARAANAPIFFVQHDGGRASPLAKGSEGFDFVNALTPEPSEDVTVKCHCSAFQDTDLFDKLTNVGVEHIVVGGMQTEFCVDTAVRGAFERGLAVTLVEDGHTTFDTPALGGEQIVSHHNHTLASGHFAKVTPAVEIEF